MGLEERRMADSELYFKGKKVTERERRLLEQVFDEKIDDLYLCQSILLAAMRPENGLARGAFTRALTKRACAYHDGVRDARRVIRRTRRKLGYRLTLRDRCNRAGRRLRRTARDCREKRGEIAHIIGDTLEKIAGLFPS
jgi:hypothetical protein